MLATKPTPTALAYPVTFTLPDKTEVTIPPPTIAQVRAMVRLDPDPAQPESEKERVLRVYEQAKVLLGAGHAHLLDVLTFNQIAELVSVVYVAGTGYDAAQFALWQHVQREHGQRMDASETLAALENLTIELSAHLSKLPGEVGAIALAEGVALQERIAAVRKDEAEFQMALHGASRK